MTDKYLINLVKPGGAIAFITSSGGLRWKSKNLSKSFKSVVVSKGWDDTFNVLNALKQQNMPRSLGYAFSKRVMNYYIATLVPILVRKRLG